MYLLFSPYQHYFLKMIIYKKSFKNVHHFLKLFLVDIRKTPNTAFSPSISIVHVIDKMALMQL